MRAARLYGIMAGGRVPGCSQTNCSARSDYIAVGGHMRLRGGNSSPWLLLGAVIVILLIIVVYFWFFAPR